MRKFLLTFVAIIASCMAMAASIAEMKWIIRIYEVRILLVRIQILMNC